MLSFLRRDPKKQLAKILGDYELPRFPTVAHNVLELIRKSDTSAADVGRTLAQDPALSLAVLKTVNSAAYGVPKKVESVAQAAGLLGLASIESIVLSVAVAKSVPSAAAPGYDPDRFWLVASWRGITARALARELRSSRADQAYTCGLLQDMAIPILSHGVGEGYGAVLTTWQEGDADLASLERDVFGWDHAEVASWLCADWALPESISGYIAGHHGTEIDGIEVPPEVSLVCLLRRPDDDAGVEHLAARAEREHGMDGGRVRDLVRECADAACEIAGTF